MDNKDIIRRLDEIELKIFMIEIDKKDKEFFNVWKEDYFKPHEFLLLAFLFYVAVIFGVLVGLVL